MFDLVAPFYEKHACLKLVIDECRKRKLAHKTERSSRTTKTMNCAAFDGREVDIHEYKDDSNEFAKIRTIKYEIEVKNVIYACGNIIVFGHGLVVSDSKQYSYFVDVDQYETNTKQQNITGAIDRFHYLQERKLASIAIRNFETSSRRWEICLRFWSTE